MLRLMRLFLSLSAAALIVDAAPNVNFPFVGRAHAAADAAATASIAPPLPAYSQPALPGPGYIWVPGYWAWNGGGYYWVPGYWALPPAAGLFWTPGYWAWNDTNHDYVYHAGYWAPKVGYYGGINYGFGYTGEGYQGGYWRGHQFVYNRAVNDLGTADVASYANQAFAPMNHISYNGGRGGTTGRPSPAQLAMAGEHVGPTAEQMRHQQAASRIPTQKYSENKGSPPITAVTRANDFRGANTSLPPPHSVAGAKTNGPFINRSLTGNGAAAGRPRGPTAATGAVRNFAPHPASIRSPANKLPPASSP